MIQSVERETGDNSVGLLQFGVGIMKSEQGRCIFSQNWALRHSVTLWTASLCRNQPAAFPTRETSDYNPHPHLRMTEELQTESCCVSTDENERVSWFIVRFTGLDPAAVADYSWFYAFCALGCHWNIKKLFMHLVFPTDFHADFSRMMSQTEHQKTWSPPQYALSNLFLKHIWLPR